MLRTKESVWLRVGDVAALLGVSANTVRRWTDVGRIAAHRSPGGHRRYLADDVYALLPAGDGPQDGAQPGDLAGLRRESQDLRSIVHAGFGLLALLAKDPQAVPAEAARTLCRLTGAPRCDVYLGDAALLWPAASSDEGEHHPQPRGEPRPAAELVPVEGNPAAAPVTCLSADDHDLTGRARDALRRRGARSLAWAPIVVGGELAGAVELSDAGERDFSRHADLLEGLARICAEAVAVSREFGRFARREKVMHELVELSREVAQPHDFEHFVHRFSRRILDETAGDCVNVWRVSGGVIRQLVSYARGGVDPDSRDAVLDTSLYPSLELTILDHSPVMIGGLRDPRLGESEVELYRHRDLQSSLIVPLVAGGDLVGLVGLYDAGERDWSDEVEFLTGACQLVAGVFNAARLLEEAQDASRLREEIIELGAELGAHETRREIAERAAARLRTATECTDCDIWWLEEGYLRCLAGVDDDGVVESVRGKVLHLDRHPSLQQAIEDHRMLLIGSLADDRLSDREREVYLGRNVTARPRSRW